MTIERFFKTKFPAEFALYEKAEGEKAAVLDTPIELTDVTTISLTLYYWEKNAPIATIVKLAWNFANHRGEVIR